MPQKRGPKVQYIDGDSLTSIRRSKVGNLTPAQYEWRKTGLIRKTVSSKARGVPAKYRNPKPLPRNNHKVTKVRIVRLPTVAVTNPVPLVKRSTVSSAPAVRRKSIPRKRASAPPAGPTGRILYSSLPLGTTLPVKKPRGRPVSAASMVLSEHYGQPPTRSIGNSRTPRGARALGFMSI